MKEIADSLHIINKISFLDDKVEGEGIIGTCKNIFQFRNEYPRAFIAIGDNKVWKRYSQLLEDYKFLVPRIVLPAANVSLAARIGKGTVVLPQATVGDVEIGEHCIVASNCLVNSGCVDKKYVHIDCGGIVLKDSKMLEMTFIKSGEIHGCYKKK